MRISRLHWIRLWDLLFVLLVAFPLLTGGIIRSASIKFELTQSFPAGILLLIAFIFARQDWLGFARDSVVLNMGLQAWNHWCDWLDKNPIQTLLVGSLIMTLSWGAASISRHFGLESAFDLGIFTNTVWNLVEGNGYYSSVKQGINLFADHQSPSFYLFAPFFWLFPSPVTLLLLQALLLCASGILVFLLAKQYIPQKHNLLYLAPIVFWLYHPLRNINRFDFHPEITMIPCFLAAIVGIQAKSLNWRILGVLAFILALGGKETAPPVAVGICLAWLIGAAPIEVRAFTRKLAIALIPVALVVFYIDTSVVPKLFGDSYAYQGLYARFGSNFLEVIFSPILKPVDFFSHIFSGNRPKFFMQLLVPLAFMPLFGWRAFLATLPAFMILFLTPGDARISLGYHYAIEFIPGLFWAFVIGANKVVHWPWQKTPTMKPLLPLLFFIMVFSTYGRSDIYFARKFFPEEHRRWLLQEVLPCIGPDISIATAPKIVPHLATRHWVQELPNIHWGKDDSKQVDCLLFDESFNPAADMRVTTIQEAETYEFSTVLDCKGTRIMQNPGNATDCLVCQPRCNP